MVDLSRAKRNAILAVVAFFIVLLGIVVSLNVKNNRDNRVILEQSVDSQLISISMAAREMVDVEDFISYNSVADVQADQEDYDATLQRLRSLCQSVGAEYIYLLKKIDGVAYFVFDTDPVDEAIFIPYELSPVHELAFQGQDAAEFMDVDDVYGSFSTGAVPIWHEGVVVGIACTDFADQLLVQSENTTRNNTILLVCVMVVTMAAMLVVVLMLLKRIGEMQQKLEQMAHYDTLTGLPNRAYLLSYLGEMTAKGKAKSFALFFIDLDNFKKVNDNAGHDAGDELLRHIAGYLENALGNAVAFRPAPGMLNIAARIGGDEFIQVVSGVENEAQAAEMAQKLLSGFQDISIDRYISKYGVGLSVGIALYPYHSDNFHVLIKYADIAMYHAKESGKNTYRIYDDSMSQDEQAEAEPKKDNEP